MEATTASETGVRTSYGRLVAYLAARSRDVAGAEAALSEALEVAGAAETLDDSRPSLTQSRQRGRMGGRIWRR